MIDVSAARAAAAYSDGYYVAPFANKALARRIVPKRRGSTISVPLATWEQQIAVQDELFDKYQLSDISHCTTGEMRSRPVPHVFKASEVQALTQLFE